MSESQRVLGMRVDPEGPEEAVARAMEWATERRSRVICAANVHMVMEAWDDRVFQATLAQADLVVADGQPVWLACRLLGSADARHLRGQDLMLRLCAAAERQDVPIALLGSTEEVLGKVHAALMALFPALRVAHSVSPPFRILVPQEEQRLVAELNSSGARVLFVALGCPKQERWMLSHKGQVDCVMVGVGAAFDMLAGELRVAPTWMQRAGLEWIFRLAVEPRRLWRRYAQHNFRFVVLLGRDLARRRIGRGAA
jgi:N-acetylglucosaminyldiphosphoundecaprenol N-acetyl-beta-D-mannosaminyltransferase